MTIKFFVQPDEADRSSLELLFNNLSLFQKYQDFILQHPEYYNIHIKGCGVFPLYVSTFPLFLGDLLLLWSNSEWKDGDDYFYCITGSPLSGSNSSRCWNPSKGLVYKYSPNFSKQLRSALTLLNEGTCQPKNNSAVSAEAPKRKASKITLENLFQILETQEDRDC